MPAGVTASPAGESGVRVDARTGTTEKAEFLVSGDGRIFSFRYVPRSEPRDALVIVPSVHAELLNAYRLEVLLSRMMAARGTIVQRFHYRGSGHSDGDSAAMSFESMVEDTLAAARAAVDEARGKPLTFLGTRVGAVVAAAAAARYGEASLVLWEPVTDVDRYFRESFRARKIRNMGNEPDPASADPRGKFALFVEELLRDGVVDVLGYPIDSSFFTTFRGRTLVEEMGDVARTVLLCQIGRSPKPRGEYGRLIARWREHGFDVHLESIQQNEISWLQPDPRKRQEEHQPLIDVTARWLTERNRDPVGA